MIYLNGIFCFIILIHFKLYSLCKILCTFKIILIRILKESQRKIKKLDSKFIITAPNEIFYICLFFNLFSQNSLISIQIFFDK